MNPPLPNPIPRPNPHSRKTTVRRLYSAALLCLLLLLCATSVHAQYTTEALREAIRDELTAEDIMAPVISGMLNATLSPDISSAFYRIGDDEGDLLLSASRIPLEKQFELKGRDWRPVVRLTLGYMSAENQAHGYLYLPDSEGPLQADNDWRGLSGLLEGGAVVPLGHGFRIEPFLGVGLAYLKNDTDYTNDISNQAAPILDGLLFNWEVTSLVAGGAVAAAWQGDIGPVNLETIARVSLNYLDTIAATDQVQEFSTWVTTLDLRATLSGGLGVSLWGAPLGWQVLQDYTHVPGSQDDGLGIDHYFETGAALTLDITPAGLLVKSLRLGGSIVYGHNVSGWSVLFGYAF